MARLPLIALLATTALALAGCDSDAPPATPSASAEPSDNALLSQASSFEARACACQDAGCADRVLEELYVFGRTHVAPRHASDAATTLESTLGRAVDCAAKHVRR